MTKNKDKPVSWKKRAIIVKNSSTQYLKINYHKLSSKNQVFSEILYS